MDFEKANETLTALRESLEETTSGWLKGPLNQIFLAKRDLDALKGSFYYRLHGRGSVKDDTRTDSGPYYTPAERAKVAAVEKKVLAFEQEIQDLLDKGHVLEREIKAIDKLMGLGHV